jgi:addiction module RelE/StbE family toxin
MQILYKSEAVKNLKKLAPSEKQKAKRKIDTLLANPLAGKKLKGEFSGLRSIRTWPLRIIYTFDAEKQILQIVTVDYRGSVYH